MVIACAPTCGCLTAASHLCRRMSRSVCQRPDRGPRACSKWAWRRAWAHIADAGAHQSLFDVAADDARLLVDQDPELETERGQAARIALYLHERDAAIKLLRSG